MNFTTFKFGNELQEGLDIMGFDKATPIQEQAIPIIQEGRDLIACAQTGTGKTAAFVLPILDKLTTIHSSNKVKAIIIAPTRELAKQIDMQIEGFAYFTNSSSYPIYGGGTGVEFDNQKQALKKGADIIICTPGRLLAHLDFDYFDTSAVEFLILDEADRMLDMGFYDDIITITKQLPKKRQTLMFSATMPPKIRELATKLLKNPASISLAISKPAAGITQTAYMCHDSQKVNLVREILRAKGKDISHVLIFASSIKSVREIKKTLTKAGMRASEMHSGLEQEQREETIRDFKSKKIRILVATDILSRGIDIKGIELVINYEVPHDAEDYVHRIGRTARADSTGEAITFINPKQVRDFMDIEKLIEKEVPKLNLPQGFETAPEYQIVPKEKKKKWQNFKKKAN
ncbi:MAG: RNA helicase [Cryomorphaceae bacterium BACL11 MAG-121015-bin20]|jgi:ATP-dependent RNA helicase RhlE|nr:MAG: RNA helicase [Cryomorphaceae bacterium BACL11 MAG-121015-bin20]MBC8474301.1 DEAD/DEAH box helicase [Cryomorphaceae bacterium]MDA0682245.1 DEAD/DEAH box helicase [Bacteroidota bacterium]